MNRRRAPTIPPAGHEPDHRPVVLQCPRCHTRVVLDLPAVATCVACAKRMRQVTSHADQVVKA